MNIYVIAVLFIQLVKNAYLCAMNLYFFNYSHELALACGQKNYYPPEHVRQMEHDLMPLAAWFASKDDEVVVAEDMPDVCSSFYTAFCPEVRFVTVEHVSSGFKLIPWGMNSCVHRLFENKGILGLSTESKLQKLRSLTSRQRAVEMLLQIRQDLPSLPLCGSSVFCSDFNSVIKKVEVYPHTVLKAPISGSGRGLRFVNGVLDEPLTGWCRNILQSQDGLVVEPLLDKRADLAAEFHADSTGEVHFEGLSVFSTTPRCSYIGNLVGRQELLYKKRFRDFPEEAFLQVIHSLEHHLTTLLHGHYEGPLGVDMMLCHEDGVLKLHPCVEINLRHTMGTLALQLARFVAIGHLAEFKIRYDRSSASLESWKESLPRPCFDTAQHLCSGSLLLSPVLSDSHYAAWLQIVV